MIHGRDQSAEMSMTLGLDVSLCSLLSSKMPPRRSHPWLGAMVVEKRSRRVQTYESETVPSTAKPEGLHGSTGLLDWSRMY